MKEKVSPSLFVLLPIDRFLLSHRREVVEAALAAGYRVTVVCKNTGYVEQIRSLGAEVIELPIVPTGKHLREEFKTFRFLFRLLRRYRPDLVHNIGNKLILWGGLSAKLARIRGVVHAVSGLGTLFSGESLSLFVRAIMCVMRFSNHRPRLICIFQNKEDEKLFLEQQVIAKHQCRYIKGSGVNLQTFSYTPEPISDKIRIIFTGRMVRDKGVCVLIEAAERLREHYGNRVEFLLCGGLSDNPHALKCEELESLCDGSYIQWLGHRTDVKELLASSHIVAFPSYYREGVPKSLIEACAIGRPIVTTDSVGCRDTVVDGWNGFLVPKQDAAALAQRLEMLIQDAELRCRMGCNSRQYAEQNFSVDAVVAAHLKIYEELLGDRK